MTKQICDICATFTELQTTSTGKLCSHCCALVKQINNNPQLLDKLALAAQTAQAVNPSPSIDIPDVLNGVRYRTEDRDQNTWYVSVSELEENPVEIFASSAFENEYQLQSKLSNLTSITRLISLILRHIFAKEELSLQKVLLQLQRSSRQPNDIPEMLAKILANYQQDLTKTDQEEDILP